MNIPHITARGDGCFLIEGALVKDHVAALWSQGQQAWNGLTHVELDLSAVEQCDSAGLALLVDWLRIATHNGQRMVVVNMTGQIAGLVNLVELDSVFSTSP